MDSGANTASYSAANYLLEGLHEAGIDYLFSNMGTDHAPIIEALAGRKKRNQTLPKVIVCPHENTAAHMAGGYALATGRGQGVLVHVDVGTANTSNAMHNLYRSRLPVLLMAGKAPYTSHGELTGTRDNYVHFVQEPFDQGSLVRPYMKWEWTLPSGVVVKEALRRAHTVMHSEPKGPVYLMLPRETLTEMWSEQEVRSYPAERFGTVASSGVDPRLVDQLADAIIKAKSPILLTSYAGRTPGASEAIIALAEFAGIRVYEKHGEQHLACLRVLLRLHGGPGDRPGRRRPAGRRGRALVPARHQDERDDVLGADRRRRGQGRLADVELPVESAPAGQQRPHPRTGARGREGEGDLGVQASSRGSPRAVRAGEREAAGARGGTRRQPRQAGRDQSALSLPRARQADCARGRDLQRGDPQHPSGAAADPALGARHGGARRRRRARLVGRHGARHQAGAARAHGDPDRGRRQLLLQRHRLGVRGVEAVRTADPDHRARQRRLVGGEGIDAAGLSGRRRQGRGLFRGRACDRRRLRQGRRGVRRLRREDQRSGAGAGRDRALSQGGARRPHRDPARLRDAVVSFRHAPSREFGYPLPLRERVPSEREARTRRVRGSVRMTPGKRTPHPARRLRRLATL